METVREFGTNAVDDDGVFLSSVRVGDIPEDVVDRRGVGVGGAHATVVVLLLLLTGHRL